MNWKKIFKASAIAITGGAFTVIVQASQSNPKTKDEWKAALIASAGATLAAHLTQSPIDPKAPTPPEQ